MCATAIVGTILGTAVGDALGLPYEGLSKRRGARLFGPPDRYRLFFGRGMVSDDTEHTCLVAQALIVSGDDVTAFRLNLAWRLRIWLLGLPAGIGLATLKAILRLWLGFPSSRSGVYSAGNGPTMRAAIIGAAIDDTRLLQEFVRVSTRMTHTDPKAEFGSLAVALAAHAARTDKFPSGMEFIEALRGVLPSVTAEFLVLAEKSVASVLRGESTEDFAIAMKLRHGVSGYIYHTVPVVLHAWFSHPRDFRAAIESVIRCGGDTDTMAAVLGGILGAGTGKAGIPIAWLNGICEWPRSVAWMERLGERLATVRRTRLAQVAPRLSALGILCRNVFFLIVVLFHAFRRLLPPY